MKKASIIMMFSICLISCNQSKKNELETIKLIDIEFSNYSIEHGFNKAFIKYAADDAVLLKPERLPVVGKREITDYYSIDNSQIKLTWNPKYADIANSNDLGYTYGFWKLFNQKDSLLEEGTYVTIWKKQNDGSWKYVLDSGNTGLGN